MTLFTLTIHLQTDDIASVLEPLARHLEHIEVAIDYENPQPKRVHPAVSAVIDADREAAADLRAAKRQLETNAHTRKLEREAERKRNERAVMAKLSPKIIAAVACPKPECGSPVGRPCHGPYPNSPDFGMTGHTHYARREAYANQKETQK